ncbi:MAG: precorrin-6Y C5,15-methyltransferase (decarboxylating), CbiT subunit [Haloquadratum walsbyi J07HQW1]|uniref:Precorrin-6Y C5,15-methyltransferase (Decarboxylating), CbiT subunit n=1 Tax=Haloquadratum walsbyi J07HQW1 TaxID=1238424 RepID=U1PC69_9EURY|nr:MAG: precorrin-6Y C5,15-methyltransferase (decarboxylating), CbiT subunit [Haloquadratum walsbyi J07HQW1]
MTQITLPHDARAGPTKPEVRAITIQKLQLQPDDHFVDVGTCTGAISIEAAPYVARITAIERKPERVTAAQKNIAANDQTDTVTVEETEAPDGLPKDADALFLGGSRNFESVLDHAVETNVDRLVMNVSRVEPAGDAIEAFRERELLSAVRQVQVNNGYELAGATSFNANNPVYIIIGRSDAGGLT